MSKTKDRNDKLQVAVRLRPFHPEEQESAEPPIVHIAGTDVWLREPVPNGQMTKFTFDLCFDSHEAPAPHFASQADVYAQVGPRLIDSALEGCNACLLSYGQTGTGKTHSLLGGAAREDEGVVPRLARELFARLEEAHSEEAGGGFEVQVAMLELGPNDRVRDLLVPKSPPLANVRVLQEAGAAGPVVGGVARRGVATVGQLLERLEEGFSQRAVAATLLNEASSRAHTLLQLHVTRTLPQGGGERRVASVVHLVDLAGSERAKRAGTLTPSSAHNRPVNSPRLQEATAVNQSLAALGHCLEALAAASSAPGKPASAGHIPYRNSLLTFLLKDCLGGNARTMMLATISPSPADYRETLSTLRYAERASVVATRAVVNQTTVPAARPRSKSLLEQEAERIGWGAGGPSPEAASPRGGGQARARGRSAGGPRAVRMDYAEDLSHEDGFSHTWSAEPTPCVRLHDLRDRAGGSPGPGEGPGSTADSVCSLTSDFSHSSGEASSGRKGSGARGTPEHGSRSSSVQGGDVARCERHRKAGCTFCEAWLTPSPPSSVYFTPPSSARASQDGARSLADSPSSLAETPPPLPAADGDGEAAAQASGHPPLAAPGTPEACSLGTLDGRAVLAGGGAATDEAETSQHRGDSPLAASVVASGEAAGAGSGAEEAETSQHSGRSPLTCSVVASGEAAGAGSGAKEAETSQHIGRSPLTCSVVASGGEAVVAGGGAATGEAETGQRGGGSPVACSPVTPAAGEAEAASGRSAAREPGPAASPRSTEAAPWRREGAGEDGAAVPGDGRGAREGRRGWAAKVAGAVVAGAAGALTWHFCRAPKDVRIRGGDTLYRIGKQRQVPVHMLVQANPSIADPNKIRAGDTLRMPSTTRTPAQG